MYPLTLDLSSVATLSDAELFKLCEANRSLHIERNVKGELILMSPTSGRTSKRNSRIISRLDLWNERRSLGIVCDSSGGFRLPNGAIRAPDAAWLRLERWQALTDEELDSFLPLCPDFVVELMSKSDSLLSLQQKMEEWMENGCRLAWLINPEAEEVVIYRANGEREIIQGFDKQASGEDVLPGFMLDLDELR